MNETLNPEPGNAFIGIDQAEAIIKFGLSGSEVERVDTYLEVSISKCCKLSTKKILNLPSSHPGHCLYLIFTDWHFSCLRTRTERLKKSFFPQTIHLLNSELLNALTTYACVCICMAIYGYVHVHVYNFARTHTSANVCVHMQECACASV